MTDELNPEAQQVWQAWSIRYLAQIQQVSITQAIEDIQASNPIYVLRNSMAQRVIVAAEQGQFEELNRVFDLLANPYTRQDSAIDLDTLPPAPHAPQMPISCSS